jgi:general L-amino acid transport system substrate-binding protein
VIKQVGNFEEMWERNITPIGVPRGINALWTKGGLMYAPPIR